MTNFLKDTKVSMFTQVEIDYIDHLISIKETVFVVKILPKFHFKKTSRPL